MARKLKTFTTSIGFYDLAVAAPSMKAALEAWGASQNLFHQGLAQQTEDLDIIAAAMALPGTVLRRAVGTQDRFQEHARPPRTISGEPRSRPRKPAPRKHEPDEKAQKAAVIRFEDIKARRDRERRREEARQAKEEAAARADQPRRDRTIARITKELEHARARHDAAMKKLERQRTAMDRRIDAERDRWRQAEEALKRRIRHLDS